ncbi:unnamed protein product [Anisakis simplex]|uniref:Translin n=1 Tax=Anisakis simplex TaxID=6269 RepID=A0A0M3JQ39_ANISI|nr:unnamed protein product [Anisakis simplex]
MKLDRTTSVLQLTLEALERLLNVVDETKQAPSIIASFEKIRNVLLSQKDVLEEIYRQSKREGYQRVRKVFALSKSSPYSMKT